MWFSIRFLLSIINKVEYRPGHYHANKNGEGIYSQNVHEVGRWIDENGSNFWGVHVDTLEIDGVPTQVILGSDMNNGLYIFTYSCETRGETGETYIYCDPSGAGTAP